MVDYYVLGSKITKFKFVEGTILRYEHESKNLKLTIN